MLIYNSVITEAVMRTWLHGQAVKTLASHAGIRGSIPLGVTGKARFYGLFSCLKNKSVSNGVSNIRLDIEESKILKEEILDVFLSRSIKWWLFLWFDGKIKEKKG